MDHRYTKQVPGSIGVEPPPPPPALQCKNACNNTLKSEDLLVNKSANHNMISYFA